MISVLQKFSLFFNFDFLQTIYNKRNSLNNSHVDFSEFVVRSSYKNYRPTCYFFCTLPNIWNKNVWFYIYVILAIDRFKCIDCVFPKY